MIFTSKRRAGWCGAVVCAGALSAMGTSGTQPRDEAQAAPIEAVTRPVYDAQLGFAVVGRVVEVKVKPGDQVKAGQELIRLDDAVPQAQWQLLTLRAESELEVQAAQGDWDLAKLQRELVGEAFKKQAATSLEVERAVLEEEKARLAFELFRQRREEAKRQAAEGRERLAQFTLRAPRDGEVDRLVAEPGEIVQEQRPVLRLVDVSVLRVDVPVPIPRSLGLRPGQPVWMTYPESPGTTMEGRVVHLAPVGDAASNTRVVRLEFDNPKRDPAGRAARVWLVNPQ